VGIFLRYVCRLIAPLIDGITTSVKYQVNREAGRRDRLAFPDLESRSLCTRRKSKRFRQVTDRFPHPPPAELFSVPFCAQSSIAGGGRLGLHPLEQIDFEWVHARSLYTQM